MKRLCILLAASLFALSSPLVPLAASEAFNSAVEDSRTPDGDGGSARSNGADGGHSGSSSASNDAAELFVQLCAFLWLHNLCVRYAPYPYCYDGEKFLVWEEIGDFYSGDFRLRRFAFDTGAVFLGDLGVGNESRIDCMFLPFLGIRGEHLLLCETARSPDISGNFRTSVQVPLIQTNPLCWYVDAGASFWYGNVHPLLKDGGFLLGFEFRSYPFKPLALRVRLAWQFFDDDVELFDAACTAGVMLRRWEIFAGGRTLTVSNSAHDEATARWNGATLGARLYW